MSDEKLSGVKKFFKKRKTLVCLILLVICAVIIVMTCVSYLKRNYFYTIGEPFETPDMLVSDNIAAQFGSKSLTKQEYSFLYYSCLYSSYPGLKSKKFNQINNYINSVPFDEENNVSIAQEIQTQTENIIVKMYSYLQDAEDKGIEIDAKDNIDGYILSLESEAKSLKMDLDEYLSSYYGEGASKDTIINVVSDYQKSKQYESDILDLELSGMSDEEVDKKYEQSKDMLDVYYFSFLAYEFSGNEGDEEKAEIKEEVTKLYNDTHSKADLDKLSAEFCESHKEEVDEDRVIYVDNEAPYDYITIYMMGSQMLEWITDSDRKKDSAGLFELEDGYIVIYFNGRERDERPTYNGLYISADRQFETIDGGALQPTIYRSIEESPYFQIISDLSSQIEELDKSELSSEKLLELVTNMDPSAYSGEEKMYLNTTELSNSMLPYDIDTEEVNKWAQECENNSHQIISNNPYFSILYISSKGLPNYKASILESAYTDEKNNIETSYSPMFSNITYLHE